LCGAIIIKNRRGGEKKRKRKFRIRKKKKKKREQVFFSSSFYSFLFILSSFSEISPVTSTFQSLTQRDWTGHKAESGKGQEAEEDMFVIF